MKGTVGYQTDTVAAIDIEMGHQELGRQQFQFPSGERIVKNPEYLLDLEPRLDHPASQLVPSQGCQVPTVTKKLSRTKYIGHGHNTFATGLYGIKQTRKGDRRIYSLITPSLDGRGAGVWIQDQVLLSLASPNHRCRRAGCGAHYDAGLSVLPPSEAD